MSDCRTGRESRRLWRRWRWEFFQRRVEWQRLRQRLGQRRRRWLSGRHRGGAGKTRPEPWPGVRRPIVGATVEVYEAENFDGVVICTATTSAANAPEGPGVVNLSACPISVSSVYFLVVHGGMDIDANDDKIVDASPAAKQGSLRAIISGRSIRDGNFESTSSRRSPTKASRTRSSAARTGLSAARAPNAFLPR